MKVLLFSNDVMPFGDLPTSGGGLRCWQLKCGLEAHGIEVHSSMPAFTYLVETHKEKIPKEQQELLWNWETQDEILRRVAPDAVMFASNWDHYGLAKKPDIPLIIDLHGSRLIETTMWNQPVSTERKLDILSTADCLLTAGTRQRLYFYGWLLQAGRVPRDEHFIRYIPISLSPEKPQHNYPEELKIVSGGGWFPWQNQSKAIFEICNAISRRDEGEIHIYGTPHMSQQLSPAEREIREVFDRVKSLSESSSRINVHGYIGRNDLLNVYHNSSVALELMQSNLEREIAFTTRTIEYLWCGLPVIYNNFSEISDHIKEYDAGWVVDPDSESEIREVIDEMFSDPEVIKKKGANASRLVAERFSWDKTIMPLVEYLNAPTQVPVSTPYHGGVFARPTYLIPRGERTRISLGSSAARQQVVLPADGISSIEIAVELESLASDYGGSLSLEAHSGGKRLARASIPISEIPRDGVVELRLPFYKRRRGGTLVDIELAFSRDPGEKANTEVGIRGISQPGYPFTGLSIGENVIEDRAVALSFSTSESFFDKVSRLSLRALGMARSGQWRRVARAIRRRIPLVVAKVRQRVAA